MESVSHTHTGNTMNNVLSICFFSLAWVFNGLQDLTVGDVYNIVFKGLSLISVLIVIIINYPKAKEVLKRRNERTKDS